MAARRGGGRRAATLDVDGFVAALERGGPPAIVVAAGPETFLQDRVVAAFLTAILGDADSPDAIVLQGPVRAGESDAVSLAAVLEDVRTPSLFGGGRPKTVVVRRADRMLADEEEGFAAALDQPPRGAHLLLSVEAAPGERSTGARLKRALAAAGERAMLVACAAPSAEPGRGGGPSPLARWIAARAAERGRRLDPADAEILVLRSGTVLATLAAAVDAAILHAGDAPRITPADLEAVAPRGAMESIDRFTEATLHRDAREALRVLAGLYREGATPWGARGPVRGETAITFLLLNSLRRLARDARAAHGGGGMPPSLRFGCRDARGLLQRSRPAALAALLAELTGFEADLKGGFGGGERTRFEALVLDWMAAA